MAESVHDAVQTRMRAALAPLREELEGLDRELASKHEEIRELKEARASIVRVLSAVEPRKHTTRRTLSVPSAEKVEIVEEWLDKNLTKEDDITIRFMLDRLDGAMSYDVVRRSLDALQIRGVLRLDRLERGGRKVWRMTS